MMISTTPDPALHSPNFQTKRVRGRLTLNDILNMQQTHIYDIFSEILSLFSDSIFYHQDTIRFLRRVYLYGEGSFRSPSSRFRHLTQCRGGRSSGTPTASLASTQTRVFLSGAEPPTKSEAQVKVDILRGMRFDLNFRSDDDCHGEDDASVARPYLGNGHTMTTVGD
ncbi:hypothetical protein AVEN_95202-1 [Araneus ventricosus]|uniref:Uncharacterized protein n=1 Tax=Araneus ventricosus TaxID=182803 RepID=A0A4Y2J612_ARAVE|nr:hypothetical protein AVEN_95202-1 [Araneus ventricosus]